MHVAMKIRGGDLNTCMRTQREGGRILGNQMRIMKEDGIARTQLEMTMAKENFFDTQAYRAFSRLGEGTTWR